MVFDEITPAASERRIRVVLAATMVALLAGGAARFLFGPTGSTVVVVIFSCGLICYQFPMMYPRRWWKFFFRVPTRLAYRRAGTRDWTVAADLARHGVIPEHVADMCAAHSDHPRNIADEIAWLLNHAKHPDGPLAAAVARTADRFDIGGSMGPLLDLPAGLRGDALALHSLPGIRLMDLVFLCQARMPYALAKRAVEHATGDPNRAVMRMAKVWSDEGVSQALNIDRGSEASLARLTEHLHEWMDAQPILKADVIASYGTVPLAGWWHAAGYGPDEARQVAEQRDWSLGQLRALAALRQGPPVLDLVP